MNSSSPHHPLNHTSKLSSVLFSSLVLTPRSSVEVPDSRPLPAHLAQLSGIHYVLDGHQDLDLSDHSTISSITQSLSITPSDGSVTSTHDDEESSTGSSPSIDQDLNQPGPCHCLICASLSPTHSAMTEPDSGSLTRPELESLHLSPPHKSNHAFPQRRLSPRTCKAASPPIDLESPFAPYAPTPPLSPPVESTFEKPMGGFHLPKSLRKLPSTASMFKMGSKPFTSRAHEVLEDHPIKPNSYHSLSSDSLKDQSPSVSHETDGRASDASSSMLPPSRLHGSEEVSRSSLSSRPSISSSTRRFGELRHKFSFTSQTPTHLGHPLTRNTTDFHSHSNQAPDHEIIESDSSDESNQIQSKNLFRLPLNRIRTYSGLNTMFKSWRIQKPTSSSHQPHHRPTAQSLFETPYSIQQPDSYEILDSDALSTSSPKLST